MNYHYDNIYYFTDISGTFAVFPTFSPKPTEQALNQARVKIQLEIPVPCACPDSLPEPTETSTKIESGKEP